MIVVPAPPGSSVMAYVQGDQVELPICAVIINSTGRLTHAVTTTGPTQTIAPGVGFVIWGQNRVTP